MTLAANGNTMSSLTPTRNRLHREKNKRKACFIMYAASTSLRNYTGSETDVEHDFAKEPGPSRPSRPLKKQTINNKTADKPIKLYPMFRESRSIVSL